VAEKLPFLPFFGRDFYDDDRVACMGYAEQGVYVRLLWHQWVNGSIPGPEDQIAKILGQDVPTCVLPCFPLNGDGRRINPRLHLERRRIEAERASKSRGGKAGRRKQLQTQPGLSPKSAPAQPGQPEPEPEPEGTTKTSRAEAALVNEPRPRPGRTHKLAWTSRVIDTWNEVAGAAPVGPLVSALKPVYDQVHDTDRLCYGLAKWLLAGNGKYGAPAFARDWRTWVPGGRGTIPSLSQLAIEEFVAAVRSERGENGTH
jgi:hypothetical protein